MNDLTCFLDILFEGQTGWVYVPTRPVNSGGEWNQKFFHVPHQRQELEDWIITSATEADVYISPSLFSEKSARKETVKGSQVVWVEFDGNAPQNFGNLPAPALIVQSSGPLNLHVYWRVPFSTAPAIENVNRRLTYGLEADTSGWDATQVLRPPSTFNHKYDKPVETKLNRINIVATAVELQVFDSLPDPPAPHIHISPEDIPELQTVLDKYKDKFVGKIHDLFSNENVQNPDRSARIMELGHLLAEANLQHAEIVAVLLDADERIGKFRGRSDNLVRISEIASKALGKFGGATSIPFYTLGEVLDADIQFESVWGNYLSSTGYLLLAGSPGIGKTQFCLQFASFTSLGRDFLGIATKASKVAFVSLEMELYGLKKFFTQQLMFYTEEERQYLRQHLRIAIPEGINPAKDIEKLLEAGGIEGLVIDSLSMMTAKPLTDEEEVKKINAWTKYIRNKFGVWIVFVHHNRKNQSNDNKPARLSDIYGSMWITTEPESVFCLWRDPEHKSKAVSEGTQLIGLKSRFDILKDHLLQKNDETLTWGLMSVEELDKAQKENLKKIGQHPNQKLGM